jgi:hypothetical protein
MDEDENSSVQSSSEVLRYGFLCQELYMGKIISQEPKCMLSSTIAST